MSEPTRSFADVPLRPPPRVAAKGQHRLNMAGGCANCGLTKDQLAENPGAVCAGIPTVAPNTTAVQS